jgi:hypothetical protein
MSNITKKQGCTMTGQLWPLALVYKVIYPFRSAFYSSAHLYFLASEMLGFFLSTLCDQLVSFYGMGVSDSLCSILNSIAAIENSA